MGYKIVAQLGKKIRIIRKRQKISQEQLSEKTGIHSHQAAERH